MSMPCRPVRPRSAVRALAAPFSLALAGPLSPTLAGMAIVLAAGILWAADDTPRPKLSVETAFREYAKGLGSDERAVRLKALQSIMPSKADFEYLFPAGADKLWPAAEARIKKMEEQIDEIAKSMNRVGSTKVTSIDVRSFDPSKRFVAVLAIIPKDVPVYRLVLEGGEGRSGESSSYLYRDGRWFWIQSLETIPEALEKK
jgi:hypothetical protein